MSSEVFPSSPSISPVSSSLSDSPETAQRRLLSQIAESRESLLDRVVSFAAFLDGSITAHQRLILELDYSIKQSHSFLVSALKGLQRLESSLKSQEVQFERESKRFRSGSVALKWQLPSHFHVACLDYVKHFKTNKGSQVKLPSQLMDLSQSVRGHLRVFAAFQSSQRTQEEAQQILMDSKRIQEKEKRKLVGLQSKLVETKSVLKELKTMKSELEFRHGPEIERFLRRKEEKNKVKEKAAQQIIIKVKEMEKQMRMMEEQAEQEDGNETDKENWRNSGQEEKSENCSTPLANSLSISLNRLSMLEDSMPTTGIFKLPDSPRPRPFSMPDMQSNREATSDSTASLPDDSSDSSDSSSSAPEYLEIKKKFFSSLNVARSSRTQSSLAISSFRSDSKENSNNVQTMNNSSPSLTRISIVISPRKVSISEQAENEMINEVNKSLEENESDVINLKSPTSDSTNSNEKQPWWRSLFQSKEKERTQSNESSSEVSNLSPFRWFLSFGSKKSESNKPTIESSPSPGSSSSSPEIEGKSPAFRLLDEDFTSPPLQFSPAAEQFCGEERQELEYLLKSLEKLNFSQQRVWEELERILDQRENQKNLQEKEERQANNQQDKKDENEAEKGNKNEESNNGVRRALFKPQDK
jgi:hypothetical protein